MSHKINLKALGELSLLDPLLIKTDIDKYIISIFSIIDTLFDIDTSKVVLKHNLVDLSRCRQDAATEYDHPSIRPIKVSRILNKN